MSVYSYSFTQATANFKTNPHSRWHAKPEKKGEKQLATERMRQIFYPGVSVNSKIKKTDKIFTIGSCFAREVEETLDELGMATLSLVDPSYFGEKIKKGFVNRYNTYSILNEFRWAAGEPFPDNGFHKVGLNSYIDLHSHLVGAKQTLSEARALRQRVTDYFAKAFSAEVVTLTLGLIEGWYDRKAESFINRAPLFSRPLKEKFRGGDRFEFRVISFEENMRNLERIYEIIKSKNPTAQIIVTVSPVNLMATFTERDVVVANCLSKSMLRTCAETWKQQHPEDIQYFPSYEMAIYSDRKTVYNEDGMHIRRPFVAKIMEYFKETAVEM